MREIAMKLKISYNAVYYSLHRTTQTGSNQNRKRSGRPRCTTEQKDRYIRVSSLSNRHLKSSTGSFIKLYLQNTRLIVNFDEATPGCWPSRQNSSVQCVFFCLSYIFFLLASLRYAVMRYAVSCRAGLREEDAPALHSPVGHLNWAWDTS